MGKLTDSQFRDNKDFTDLKPFIVESIIYKRTKIRVKPLKKNMTKYYESKKKNGKVVWRNIEDGTFFSPTKGTLMQGCVLNTKRLRKIYKAALYFTTTDEPNASKMASVSTLTKSNCHDKNGIFNRIRKAVKRLDKNKKKHNWRNARAHYRAIFIVRTLFKKKKATSTATNTNDKITSDQHLPLPIGKNLVSSFSEII